MENVYLDLLAQANGTYDDYQSRAEQRKQETLQRLQAARAQEQQANYIAQRQIERSAPNMYAAQGYSGGPVATLDLQNRLAYENRRNETARSYDEQLNDIATSYEDWLFQLQKERLANELNYKTLAANAAKASQSSDYYSDGGMPEVEDGISNTLPGWATGYVEPNVGFAAKTPEEYASEIMAASKNKKSSIPLSGQFGVGGYSVAPGFMTNAAQKVKTPTVTTTVVGNPAKTSGSHYAQKYDKTGRYK